MASPEATLKIAQDRLQEHILRIKNCFSDEQQVADQVERACDLILDVAQQFGVTIAHENEAVILKSDATSLESEYRKNLVTRTDYQTGITRLKHRVLDL